MADTQNDGDGIGFLPQQDITSIATNNPQSDGATKPIHVSKQQGPQQAPMPQPTPAPMPTPPPQQTGPTQSNDDGIGFVPADTKPAPVTKEPDTSSMKDYFTKNLQNIEHVPGDFVSGLDAGFQRSFTGLVSRGKVPDPVSPEHAGLAFDIASNISQLAGDIPTIAAGLTGGALLGGAEGATVGSVAPGVGTVIGGVGLGAVTGMAGAFAVPAAVRKMLMDHYEKGDIKDSHEFVSRLMATGWEAIKGATIGAATSITGGAAGLVAEGASGLAAKYGATALAKGLAAVAPTAGLAGELGAMTTVGAAMEGHLPKFQDFLTGAIVLGGIHAVSAGVSPIKDKLQNIYSSTGATPAEVVESAQHDVQLKQDLLNPNPNVPVQARPSELQHFSKAEGTISEPPVKSEGTQAQDIPEPQDHWQLVPKEMDESDVSTKASDTTDEPVRTEAEKNVLATITDRPDAEATPFRDKLAQGGDALKTAIKDDLNPIKRLVDIAEDNGKLEPSQNPYMLARLFRDVSGKSLRALSSDTFDFNDLNHSTGEGLLPILKDIPGKDVTLFDAFLKSRRFIADPKMREQGISLDDAKEVVTNNPQFEDVAKRLDDYQDRMKQYAVDSGILSATKSELFDETNKNYAPLYKLLDVDPLTGKRGSSGVSSLFQKMKGSDRMSISSIQGIFENTEAIFRAAEQNRVMQALVNIPELKEADLVRETSDTEVTKDNQISAKFNGQKFIYEVQPDVATAIKAMDYSPQFTSLWAQMFAAPFKLAAAGLRVGVTGAMGFAVKHGFRANIASEIQSKYGGIGDHFLSSINSIGDVFKQSDDFWKFISSGAANGSMDKVSGFIDGKSWLNDSQSMLDQVKNISKDAAGIKDGDPLYKKAWNSIFTPVRLAEAMTQISDMAPRLAEFKKGGGTTGDLNTQIQAGFDARNVSVDYMRQGALTKMISFAQPFLNVDMQGTFRAFEGLKDPKVVAKALAIITLPEIVNFMMNKDDERYKNAPLWEHGAFMVIPIHHWVSSDAAGAMAVPESMRRQNPDGSYQIDNGPTLRLPRAFTLGAIFGSLPHMILDRYYDHNPRAFDNLKDQVLKSAMPMGLTSMLQPAFEQATNHSTFTGQPLIPNKLEKELGAFQYEPYTSEVAKQVGKLIGHLPQIGPSSAPLSSPIVIDNYIRAWGGTLGGYVVNLLDKGLHAANIGSDKNDPEMKWTEFPEIKQFFSHFPSQKAQSIEDFRNNVSDIERIQNTVKDLGKQAQIAGADTKQGQELMSQAMELNKTIDQETLSQIGEPYSALMTGGAALKIIKANNEMPAADKRKLMDTITFQMMGAAERGNKIFNAAKH